jgi:hypothetical protein
MFDLILEADRVLDAGLEDDEHPEHEQSMEEIMEDEVVASASEEILRILPAGAAADV